jgi:hypothetical protein
VLHLANSPELEDKLAAGDGRVAKLVQQKVPPGQAVEELYLAAFARYPTDEEKEKATAYIGRQKDVRRGLEDLLWAMVNSREFMFNP